jgi:hypothetical protein
MSASIVTELTGLRPKAAPYRVAIRKLSAVFHTQRLYIEQRGKYEQLRSTMLSAAAEAGVILERSPSQKDLDIAFKKQGDLALMEPAALMGRNALMRDPAITEQSGRYWHLLCGLSKLNDGTSIDRACYLQLNIKLHCALVPEISAEEASSSASCDWERDCSSASVMTHAEFQLSMFDLADTWVEQIDGAEYAAFLSRMFEAVFDGGAFRNDVIECHTECEEPVTAPSPFFSSKQSGWAKLRLLKKATDKFKGKVGDLVMIKGASGGGAAREGLITGTENGKCRVVFRRRSIAGGLPGQQLSMANFTDQELSIDSEKLDMIAGGVGMSGALECNPPHANQPSPRGTNRRLSVSISQPALDSAGSRRSAPGVLHRTVPETVDTAAVASTATAAAVATAATAATAAAAAASRATAATGAGRRLSGGGNGGDTRGTIRMRWSLTAPADPVAAVAGSAATAAACAMEASDARPGPPEVPSPSGRIPLLTSPGQLRVHAPPTQRTSARRHSSTVRQLVPLSASPGASPRKHELLPVLPLLQPSPAKSPPAPDPCAVPSGRSPYRRGSGGLGIDPKYALAPEHAHLCMPLPADTKQPRRRSTEIKTRLGAPLSSIKRVLAPTPAAIDNADAAKFAPRGSM